MFNASVLGGMHHSSIMAAFRRLEGTFADSGELTGGPTTF